MLRIARTDDPTGAPLKGSPPAELDAVTRWRRKIAHVATEEIREPSAPNTQSAAADAECG